MSAFRPAFSSLIVLCAAVLAAALAPRAAAAATPGALDSSFGTAGAAATGSATRLFAAAVQSDGDVVAVGEGGTGSSARVLVARFTASGALDGAFGRGGIAQGPAVPTALGAGSLARAVAIQPDGKIVIVGKTTDAAADPSARYGLLVERYDPSGTLDTSFGDGGVVNLLSASFGDGYAIALQPDGRIVATGSENVSGVPYATVVRLNTDGSLDSSFGSAGTDLLNLGAYSYALAVAIQSDGKLVIAGSQSPGLQATNALIARLTTSGALDSSFNGGGAVAQQYAPTGGAFSSFDGVAIQSDGKIVAAGNAAAGGETADAFAVRFNSAGTQDSSFGHGGVAYAPSATDWLEAGGTVPGAAGVTIATNGDVVAAGQFVNGLNSYGALWAFTPSGALDGTFGAGGVAQVPTSSTEFDGVALSPATGDLVAAGDSLAFGGAYTGTVASYVGYGALKLTPTATPTGAPVPNPTPTPTPTRSPTPIAIPTLRLSVSGVKRIYITATVLKHGLKLAAGCNEGCSLHVALIASTATARRLHIKTAVNECRKAHGKRRCGRAETYRPLALSPQSGTLATTGSRTFVLHVGGAFAKGLRTQKRVGLTVEVTATSTASHAMQVVKTPVVFKS